MENARGDTFQGLIFGLFSVTLGVWNGSDITG